MGQLAPPGCGQQSDRGHSTPTPPCRCHKRPLGGTVTTRLRWVGLIFRIHLLHFSRLWCVTLPRKALQPASKAKRFCKAHAKVLKMVVQGLLGVGEDFPAPRPHLHIPLAGCAHRLQALGTDTHLEVIPALTSPTAFLLLTPPRLSMGPTCTSLSSLFPSYPKGLLCLFCSPHVPPDSWVATTSAPGCWGGTPQVLPTHRCEPQGWPGKDIWRK